MRNIAWVLASSVVVVGCGGGGGGGSVDGPPAGGQCPFTLTVDGTTYDAVDCQLQGGPTAAAHLYQIDLAAEFNHTVGMVRSVQFTLRDDTETPHVHDYVVGADSVHPSVDATYFPTSLDPGYSTQTGGSGTFTVTTYDTIAKTFSGTYSMVVAQGADTKTITGTITNAPMTRAD